MEVLNLDGIEWIDVFKGESVKVFYGEEGVNGVVKIMIKNLGEVIEEELKEGGNFFKFKGEIEKIDKIDVFEMMIEIIKEEFLFIEDEMNKFV